MTAPRFVRLFSQLPMPSLTQRRQGQSDPQAASGLERIVALIDDVGSMQRHCPHCGCARWHRHGHANNLQRFRCRQCRRTFNDLTGTPLARLRLRGKWLDYRDALLAARSVRAAASQVGVHRNTAFRWRHRFLVRSDSEP